jgi:glyoxylase-like metal-dependent hydrolase (beta-lactamase superfamily II)
VQRFPRADGLEVITLTHDATNVHVVKQGDAAFLFDTGYEKHGEAVEADLRALGLDPAKLKAVVVSHAHADHAGAARFFQQHFKVPVVVGAGDEPMFAAGQNEPLCPQGLIANLRRSGDQAGHYTGSTPDVVVSGELDLKELTGIDAKAVLVPGHTRGSVVVVAGDVVLVGDLLRGSIIGSGAETHFFMCDLEENKRNVARVLSELAPKAATVFTGHFGPVTPEAVREHFLR